MNQNVSELAKNRLVYLDNVRSLVIFLVITIHAAVTYSGIGDWYYKEGALENLSLPEQVFFAFSQSFIQSWFMGILFFISAFFAVKALAKRGPFNFIKERLFRLGLPLLLYIFIISPIINFLILKQLPENSFFSNYILYVTHISWWLDSTGPMWFVEALLIFCIIYAVIKKCFSGSIKIQNINLKNIVFTIMITAITAFLIRLAFPIDSEKFFNLQLWYFGSYIVMFTAGVLIGENNLLDKITDEKNIKWIKLSLLIGTPIWIFIVVFGGVLDGIYHYQGGFYWQSFAYALWESLTAIGFSIGIIALFKKKMNTNNKFSSLISDNAFGMYFFHPPIIVIVSLLFRYIVLVPIVKFAVVTVITYLICFIFTFAVRKIKPIGILFK